MNHLVACTGSNGSFPFCKSGFELSVFTFPQMMNELSISRCNSCWGRGHFIYKYRKTTKTTCTMFWLKASSAWESIPTRRSLQDKRRSRLLGLPIGENKRYNIDDFRMLSQHNATHRKEWHKMTEKNIHLFAGRAVKQERRKGRSRRQQPAYGAAVNKVACELLRSARSPKRENGGRRYIKHDGMIASPVGSCLCCWQLLLSSSFSFCILSVAAVTPNQSLCPVCVGVQRRELKVQPFNGGKKLLFSLANVHFGICIFFLLSASQ